MMDDVEEVEGEEASPWIIYIIYKLLTLGFICH